MFTLPGFDDEAIFRDATSGRYDALAAENTAAALRSRLSGFTLFRSGGRPKLERRSQSGWATEILVRASDTMAWVEYHHWSPAVAELRRRYCKDRHPPMEILSGNLGRLLSPPIWTAWPREDTEKLDQVAEAVKELERLLATPSLLASALNRYAFPLLTRDRVVELLYLKGNPHMAQTCVDQFRRGDPYLDAELAIKFDDHDAVLMGPYAAYAPELRLIALVRACRLAP